MSKPLLLADRAPVTLAACLTALSCAAAAQVPSDSVLVAKANSDGTAYYLRLDRLRMTAKGRSVWLHEVKPEPTVIKAGLKAGSVYNYVISNWIVSCAEPKYYMAQSTFYTRSGSVVHMVAYPEEWEEAIPDSVGDGIVSGVCMLADENFRK